MSEIINAYDAISGDYEDYSLMKSQYLKSVESIIISEIKGKDGVLDIGTGDGRRFDNLIKALGLKDFMALEPSSKMVELCKKREIPVLHAPVSELSISIDRNFNYILALWNVLGHISSGLERLDALKQINAQLVSGGIFICDVNNRHNMNSYGYLKVIGRIIADYINFSEERGDARYIWKINGKDYQGFGHLFTPNEADKLFTDAGFEIKARWTVDYETGAVSRNKFRGQLLYKLKKI